ncbi:MAG: phosphoglucosamine mutase [Elusimicrobia bacterium]|nr:phosphoglucosamine mutase [Elusimicrobiota bacterium]
MADTLSIFGTDGIRGRPGQFPLINDVLVRLGPAFSGLLDRRPSVLPPSRERMLVIARDTRASGRVLNGLVARSFQEAGFIPHDLGILPTPAIAYLVAGLNAALGCVISASHNPPEYNGLKFFGPRGQKIPEDWERDIEKQLLGGALKRRASPARKRRAPPGSSLLSGALRPDWARRRYMDFLKSRLAAYLDFRGLTVVVDAAHGAAAQVLPDLLRELGAVVHVLGVQPNGRNINVDCGALHPQRLASMVLKKRADIGFALDGDGDRLVVVDERGRALPGEWVLATVALERRRLREKGSDALVTTQVSNFALRHFLEKNGVGVIETKVGDRWVLEALQEAALGFGGENSGHFIWPFVLPSADGCLGAMMIVQMLLESGRPASKLFARFPLMPQAGLQVPSPAEKPPLESLPVFLKELGLVSKALDHKGRVLVRYSGTEPVLRILLEGEMRLSGLKTMAESLKQAYLKAIE